MEIIAYEMKYVKDDIEKNDIQCIPFEKKYNFLNNYEQIIQNKGYGKQLLLWGINYIRESSNESISLHVAKWNEKALKLYEKVGFNITNTEIVR